MRQTWLYIASHPSIDHLHRNRRASYMIHWRAISILTCFVVLTYVHVHAQSCSRDHSLNGIQRSFNYCNSLVEQGATLAWTKTNGTLAVVFTGTATESGGWVGWGINLGPSPVMMGSDTFIAFRSSNGSNLMTYKITSSIAAGSLSPGAVSIRVLDRAVEFAGLNVKIYLSLELPSAGIDILNHIWNRGSGVNPDFSILPHDMSETRSTGRINTNSGTQEAGDTHQTMKNSHAIVNVIGWGVLLPTGIMFARYIRPFKSANPEWFYIHVVCQISGFLLGISGFVTGILLGRYTSIIYHKHRNLGFSIIIFSAVQIASACILRPKKDHKLRSYWDVSHHLVGYCTILMGFINIFEGFNILQPAGKYKYSYIGVLVFLGVVSLIMEGITCTRHLLKFRKVPSKRLSAPIGLQDVNNFRSV